MLAMTVANMSPFLSSILTTRLIYVSASSCLNANANDSPIENCGVKLSVSIRPCLFAGLQLSP